LAVIKPGIVYVFSFRRHKTFRSRANDFFLAFYKSSRKMAYNVPAVYDVLPARIRALRSKDQGWQNVPEQRRGNERSD
jgi:hypothetical protein